MKRLVAVSAVFIAVVAAGVVAWDYTIKATNRDLCIDLARFIADLHKTDDPAENLQVRAFKATELVGSASRRLERWQGDSNEYRLVVVRQMESALTHYRRVAELYHAAASGNVDPQAFFAELGVKRDAGGGALQDAVGSAAMGKVVGPSALSLSASGRRDIRETVELLFATELAQARNDPQYKAGPDVWAAIFLHDSLK